MKLHQRYLLWQLTLPTLFAILAFSGAVWLSQSLRFVDLIVNKGLPLSTFLYLSLLLFPSLLLVILPLSLFSAVLFVYHRLSVESELTALQATGLSHVQLAVPCLLLAGLVTVVAYATSLYFMPLAFRSFKDLQYELRGQFSQLLLQPGVFNTPTPNVTVYVRDQQGDGSLSGILVHDERRQQVPVTLMAEQGFLVEGDEGPLFILENGNRQELDLREAEAPNWSILHFDRYTLDLAATAAGRPNRSSRKPKELFLGELLHPSGEDLSDGRRLELIAEGHKRLTLPLNALVFSLIGLAALLRERRSRRKPWRGILIAVIGAIAVQALGMASGSLPERSLAWVPLIYIAVLGPAALCWLLVRGYRPPLRPPPPTALAPA